MFHPSPACQKRKEPTYKLGTRSVLQSCPTLCDPIDCNPTRLLGPWDSPGKNARGGCHAFLQGIVPTQEMGKIGIPVSYSQCPSSKRGCLGGRDPLSWQEKGKQRILFPETEEEKENPVVISAGQKTKIMASGSITSWQIDGETMKTVR